MCSEALPDKAFMAFKKRRDPAVRHSMRQDPPARIRFRTEELHGWTFYDLRLFLPDWAAPYAAVPAVGFRVKYWRSAMESRSGRARIARELLLQRRLTKMAYLRHLAEAEDLIGEYA